eukprot:3488955-Lingulodinium_polyedra.AAC.2
MRSCSSGCGMPSSAAAWLAAPWRSWYGIASMLPGSIARRLWKRSTSSRPVNGHTGASGRRAARSSRRQPSPALDQMGCRSSTPSSRPSVFDRCSCSAG